MAHLKLTVRSRRFESTAQEVRRGPSGVRPEIIQKPHVGLTGPSIRRSRCSTLRTCVQVTGPLIRS